MARSSYEELTDEPTQTCRVACPATSAHRDDVAGRGRQRDQRLERAEVDRLELVVAGARRRRRARSHSSSRPCAREPRARLLVAREDPGRRAGLHDHVADRPAVGRGQRRHAVAGELEDRARARRERRAGAAARGRRPSTAPTGGACPASSTPDDPRALERRTAVRAIATATSVAPAPIASIPSAPGHRRVAVGADQEPARPGEALEVQVVGDAVSGPRVERAVARGELAEVRVVLGILVVDLERRCGRRTRRRAAPRRGRSRARSNWRHAIVPVASSSRTWSTRSSISCPLSPTRRSAMIFRVSVSATGRP